MKQTLGGSIFVRNAIQYDYCILEAVSSLAALCDNVAILDCYSDDGTTDMVADHCRGMKNVNFMTNGDWNCTDDYHKLAKLANAVAGKLDNPWHFMLQADEVIHENSFEAVRRLIENKEAKTKAYAVRRLNLFGTVDRHIRFDLPHKPCSDRPSRLGRKGIQAAGDGESFVNDGINTKHIDEVTIFHYGYVREDQKNLMKAIDMQTWFWGKGKDEKDVVDGRLLAMRDNGEGWDAYKILPESSTAPNKMDHPMFSKDWADKRR